MQCRTAAKKAAGHGKNQGKPRKGKRLGMKRYEGRLSKLSLLRLNFTNIQDDHPQCHRHLYHHYCHHPSLSLSSLSSS